MKYNFDEIINRNNTNALSTDGFRSYMFHAGPDKVFPYRDEEFIRMWVADMEFATPPEICDAIKERANQRIFGYSKVFDTAYYSAFSAWCENYYDWHFPQEELVFSAGVIPALYGLVEELVDKDEKMLITTPSYGFFKHAATYNQVDLVYSPLKNEDGYFCIDFDDFAKKAADAKMKLVVWCSPHNPTGRLWNEEELKRIAEIIEKNNLWVISDEIHCDLLRTGNRHIPLGKVMPNYEKLITCMSASKTFNLAGLMFANIIIRDEELHKTFEARDKNAGFVNPLSLAAHQAAYEKGGAWLEQLKEYLDDNFRFVKEYLDKHLPEAVFVIPEATYLAWIDIRHLLPGIDDVALFFAELAGVLLEGGDDLFVDNAQGYIRLNLAMPNSIVEEGLKRICRAIDSYNQ